jgi:hypothetical protein
MAGHGELAGEQGEGGEGAQVGAAPWGGAAKSSSAPATPCSVSVQDCLLLNVRKKKRRRKERRKRKGRKRKEKKKKKRKIFKLEYFQGEK